MGYPKGVKRCKSLVDVTKEKHDGDGVLIEQEIYQRRCRRAVAPGATYCTLCDSENTASNSVGITGGSQPAGVATGEGITS